MSAVAVWISLVSTLLSAADDPECYILGGLDVARAEALADANMSALGPIYANAAASAPDRRLLRRYASRGYRVVGAGMVRDACRLVGRTDGRIELEVVERLSRAWAISETGAATKLPRGRLEQHRVVLTGGEGAWRIASVR